MSYRGHGGYRGDLLDGLDLPTDTVDFSDVTGGSSSLSLDDTFSTMDPGSALTLPNVDYGSIVNSIAGGGIPSTISGIINAWKGGGGGGGGSAGPGVGSGGGASGSYGRRRGAAARAGSSHTATRRVASWQVRDSRRMNPANSKALRRSLRRLKAFEHMARSVYSFTHRAKGRPHFKFHRKRRR